MIAYGARMSGAFDLVVSCCRHAFAGDAAQDIEARAIAVDWPLLLKLARRHRVEGFVWDALASTGISLPSDIAEALRSDATAIADHNLRSAGECALLDDAFAVEDIPLLFLKGLALAHLAYSKPFLKMGWDIDLLIAPDRVGDGAALLSTLGYRAILPDTSEISRIVRWHRSRKESIWHNPERKFFVELHTRLADNERLIPRLNITSARQIVPLTQGVELSTLADPELFTYLTVHGASSAWFRLKWITDFAGFLHRRADQVAEYCAFADKFGAGRAPAQALLLAHRLFGEPLVDRLVAQSAASRWLANRAYAALNSARAIEEPTERRFGTLDIHLTQFALKPGLNFKASELARQARYLFS